MAKHQDRVNCMYIDSPCRNRIEVLTKREYSELAPDGLEMSCIAEQLLAEYLYLAK